MKLSLQDICYLPDFCASGIQAPKKKKNFSDVPPGFSHDELIDGRDVTKPISNLLIHYSTFDDLVHPYTQDSVDCGVMEST